MRAWSGLLLACLTVGCFTIKPATDRADATSSGDAPSIDSGLDASDGVTPPIDQPPSPDQPDSGCAAGMALCGGACRNLQLDMLHCGACGNACADRFPDGISACVMGRCTLTGCARNRANCDNMDANGCEANLTNSLAHCGRCGQGCTLPHAVSVCTSGFCDVRECDLGWADCNGNPLDGCEVDLARTPAHCRSCNNACPAMGGRATCVAGVCGVVVTTCPTGREDCDAMSANGCEANLQTDLTNCGACGANCATPNATPACAEGRCTVGRCNAGFGDCDNAADNGCETDLTRSMRHCGQCGRSCEFDHGVGQCTAQGCRLVTCESGFGDCDGNQANGCETNLAASATHCGMCGRACSAGNACREGACISGCAAGQITCSGRCVSAQTDMLHCGRCDNACAAVANGVPSCTSGACQLTCNTGFGNCDNNAANGCEANLAESNSHCGACGMACTGGRTCTAGRCGCPSGQTLCGGTCVNTAQSAAHCGMCGRACQSGETCSSGVCGLQCPSGQTACAGACRDTTSDASHCGACGNACTNMRQCRMGQCQCPTGLTDCNGTCRRLTNDVANCGRCGNVCSVDNGTAACTMGACTIAACTSGFADCDMLAGNGCEASLQSSTSHCGMCMSACQTGQMCMMGMCGGCSAPGIGMACTVGTGACQRMGMRVCGVGLAQSVAAGGGHSCALLQSGTVRCWGNGTNGEIGDGATMNRTAPTTVMGLTGAVEVRTGTAFSCARVVGGTVRCWGANSDGQLGDASTTNRAAPVAVMGLTDVLQVSAGASHVCAVRRDGTVWCWGANGSGQLGDGSMMARNAPVQVMGLSGATQVSAGALHTCARKNDGTVQCWGSNSMGQLGLGMAGVEMSGSPAPMAVTMLMGATTVVVDGNHACAATANAVYCWGANASGQLGDGTTMNRNAPVAVTGLTATLGLGAGTSHTCARVSDGVRCWGANNRGQLGDGTTMNRTTPVAVTNLTAVSTLTVGADHTCATLNGTIRCWGANMQAQLGDATTTDRNAPITVAALTADGEACSVAPGAPATETCNNIDDDCNGLTDEITCP